MTPHLDCSEIRRLVRGQLFVDIVGRYTSKPPFKHAIDSQSLGGHTWNAPCPFCDSTTDRLVLWPDRPEPAWWCSHCGGWSIFDYVMKAEPHLTFDRAVTRVAELAGLLNHGSSKPLPPPRQPNHLENFIDCDMTAWQATAGVVTKACMDRLWSPAGKQAREFLFARGLNEATLRTARVGYQAESLTMTPGRWGLPVGGHYAMQAGITIPYVDGGGTVTAIKTRLLQPFRGRGGKVVKYLHLPHGGAPVGIYGKFTLPGNGITVIQEAEIDALLGFQFAPEMAWLACPAGTHLRKDDTPAGLIVLAMDQDAAGQGATATMLTDHPNAVVAPPFPGGCKDLGESYAQFGGNAVDTWVSQVMEAAAERWAND